MLASKVELAAWYTMLRMNTLLWQAQRGWRQQPLRHASESVLKEALSHDHLPGDCSHQGHRRGTTVSRNSLPMERHKDFWEEGTFPPM